ncbi:MAG: hypothetical protein ACYDHH_04105 [Solirubrobacteraceae bacterium]
MKRKVLASFVVVLVIGALAGLPMTAGSAPASRIDVTVTPPTGSATTSFVIGFRAPDRTGRHGVNERHYVLSASGPPSPGCVASVDQRLAYARRGALVEVRLDPARLGGSWCPGTFRGLIQELQARACPTRSPCHTHASLVATIGRFTIEVTAGGGDTTPPTFAGLQSAFACTPGPQRPGQTTPFTLTWQAATDDVTPSSQIVYDVYLATAAGGENFAQPTWTTGPGVTSYRTPGLASHGSFYFVVRSRDQAGNEDHNTVEVRGVDPCL